MNCIQFSPLQHQDTSELGNICWSFILCVKSMLLPCPQQDPSVSIPYLSIIVFSPFLPIHPSRRQDYLTSPWYNPFKSIACLAWDIWKCWKIPIVQFIKRPNYLFIKIKHLPLLWVQYWYMTFPQIITNYKKEIKEQSKQIKTNEFIGYKSTRFVVCEEKLVPYFHYSPRGEFGFLRFWKRKFYLCVRCLLFL